MNNIEVERLKYLTAYIEFAVIKNQEELSYLMLKLLDSYLNGNQNQSYRNKKPLDAISQRILNELENE